MNEQQGRSWLKGALVVIIVFAGIAFYVIAKVEKKDVIRMPRTYIPEHTGLKNGKPDTTFHRVADFTGISQFGDHVSINNDLKDRLVVVNFFFSTCPSVCPKLMANMATLQKAFKRTPTKMNDTIAQLVSISVDPTRDSFQALRRYAATFKADNDHWWFLTGDKQRIYDYARKELHLVAPEASDMENDFFHSQKIVLLDKDRNIRGYYDGLDTAEIMRCANDIGLLYIEKKKK